LLFFPNVCDIISSFTAAFWGSIKWINVLATPILPHLQKSGTTTTGQDTQFELHVMLRNGQSV